MMLFNDPLYLVFSELAMPRSHCSVPLIGLGEPPCPDTGCVAARTACLTLAQSPHGEGNLDGLFFYNRKNRKCLVSATKQQTPLTYPLPTPASSYLSF